MNKNKKWTRKEVLELNFLFNLFEENKKKIKQIKKKMS